MPHLNEGLILCFLALAFTVPEPPLLLRIWATTTLLGRWYHGEDIAVITILLFLARLPAVAGHLASIGQLVHRYLLDVDGHVQRRLERIRRDENTKTATPQ